MIRRRNLVIVFVASIFTALLMVRMTGCFLSNKVPNTHQPNLDVKNISTGDLEKEIESSNALIRQNAISTIVTQKKTEFIMPIFSALMNLSVTDTDTNLMIDALYKLTDGKIVSYVVQLLINNFNISNSSVEALGSTTKLKKLTDLQVIRLLSLVSHATKEQLNKEKYDFSFLSKALESKNNDIVLSTLHCISLIGYSPLYDTIYKLYRNSDFFVKIPMIKALTLLALSDSKYEEQTKGFIISIIQHETHPNIQEESYLALYMLIQHLLTLPNETVEIFQHIASLSHVSFNTSLPEELYLLKHPTPVEEISLIQFFLSDFIPVILKARLLNILYASNNTEFVDSSWLFKNIQKKDTDNQNSLGFNFELAKISLLIYLQNAKTIEEIKKVYVFINDKRLTYTFVSGFNHMFAQHKIPNLVDSESYLRNIGEDNPELISWYAHMLYSLHGIDDVIHLLQSKPDIQKMNVLHDIAGCSIPIKDRKRLVETFLGNINETQYPSLTDEITNGVGTCRFG